MTNKISILSNHLALLEAWQARSLFQSFHGQELDTNLTGCQFNRQLAVLGGLLLHRGPHIMRRH